MCRQYRRKKNENKIKIKKNTGKSSTERSREFRARKKQLLNNQNRCSNISVNVTDVINVKNKMSEVEKYEETSAEEDSPTIECRACLQIMNADSSFCNIFDEWIPISPPWDGMESTIAEDLAKLANIQKLESDRCSHMICETCCQVLITACSFTEIVRKNDKILRERYSENVKDPENDRIWPNPIQSFEKPIDIEIKQEVKSDEECSVANGLYEPYGDDIPNLDNVKIEPEEMIQQQPSQIQITVNECRACLQIMNADSSFFNIFDEWIPPWDGMESTIAEDLAKLANIQILESDRHSHMICETCCQVLLTACSSTEIVRKNDKILRERYSEDVKDPENGRIWPKPIQSFENSIDIEIKQEVKSDEECSVTNGLYETYGDDIPNLDIVKIEPEEMIRQQPSQIQITVNGRDDEATTSTSTGSRGPRGKNAQYYRDYRARKRAEQEKESLNKTSDPLKKRKSAAEYQREYRARKKAKRDNIDSLAVIPLISTGGFTNTHQSTTEDQLTSAGPSINPQTTAVSSINSQTTAGPSTSSDIGFAKPKRRKTQAEYQREYRARKKAQRESTRAAINNDRSMKIADENTSNGGSIYFFVHANCPATNSTF